MKRTTTRRVRALLAATAVAVLATVTAAPAAAATFDAKTPTSIVVPARTGITWL